MERIEKPWGYEEIWAKTERYVGKYLIINRPHRLSFQYHKKKEETIRLLKGEMDLELGDENERETIRLKAGDICHITPKTRHRMIAVKDCIVLEVSTPELDDVVRLEDDYDRVVKGK